MLIENSPKKNLKAHTRKQLTTLPQEHIHSAAPHHRPAGQGRSPVEARGLDFGLISTHTGPIFRTPHRPSNPAIALGIPTKPSSSSLERLDRTNFLCTEYGTTSTPRICVPCAAVPSPPISSIAASRPCNQGWQAAGRSYSLQLCPRSSRRWSLVSSSDHSSLFAGCLVRPHGTRSAISQRITQQASKHQGWNYSFGKSEPLVRVENLSTG